MDVDSRNRRRRHVLFLRGHSRLLRFEKLLVQGSFETGNLLAANGLEQHIPCQSFSSLWFHTHGLRECFAGCCIGTSIKIKRALCHGFHEETSLLLACLPFHSGPEREFRNCESCPWRPRVARVSGRAKNHVPSCATEAVFAAFSTTSAVPSAATCAVGFRTTAMALLA